MRGGNVLYNRKAAKDRQERVAALVAATHERTWTAVEIHERLQSRLTRQQVDSALVALRRDGRILAVVQTNGGRACNRYVAAGKFDRAAEVKL